jgi:hypothetical protein
MTVADVPYPQLPEVAGTELAVDGQIEKGEISTLICDLESYANRPYLLKFERGFLAYEFSLFPGLTSGNCGAGIHDRLLLVGAFQFAAPRIMADRTRDGLPTVADRANNGHWRF